MRERKQIAVVTALGLVIVAGLGWWWYNGLQPTAAKFVIRGSRSSSGHLQLSGGNLVVVPPKPGLLFGTVRKPGEQEQFAYVILFKYGRPRADNSSRGIQFQHSSAGRSAEAKDALELDDKRIEAVYRIELNETLTSVSNESLAVDGKNQDLSAGRVFLVDLTSESPVYEQKNVELPQITSKMETVEDVERLGESVQQSLENDSEVQGFPQ